MSALIKEYNFAVMNGYSKSHEEYLILNYKGCCGICIRCDSEPMPFQKWIESQI